MIEWFIIVILAIAFGVSAHLLRNMVKTLNNVEVRLAELYFVVKEYDQFLKKLNASETYYGDPTIEAFVKLSNQLNEILADVLDVQNQLTGELDAEKEDEA